MIPYKYKNNLWANLFSLALVLVFLVSTVVAGEINSTWNGGEGYWNTVANWNPLGVPNNGGSNTYNVFIDGGSGVNSAVSLNTNATIDNLTIDFGDSLTVNNNYNLGIASGVSAGTITNNGSMSLNSCYSGGCG